MGRVIDDFYDLNHKIVKCKSYIELAGNVKATSDLVRDNYQHLTFKVHSLSDYLAIIKALKKENMDHTYAFRGMSNYTYDLLPSLGREQVASICDAENCMVNEMVTIRPSEFEHITSDFELLTKMQHFGIPTRLLDFSLNPLVALYFACSENFKEIGRVVCTTYSQNTDTIPIIETICGLHRYTDLTGVTNDDLFPDRKLFWRYMLDTRFPLMIKPPYFDDRIKHQLAVFMVFPNQLFDMLGRAAYLETIVPDWSNINYCFEPSEHDRNLIDYIKEHEHAKELYPNITDERLDFYVTYESFKKQNQIYSNLNVVDPYGTPFDKEMTDPFRKRFFVMDSIQSIDGFLLKNYFCSILIEPEYKASILQELDSVNINEAFIYPELEYTAKAIKHRFFM